MESETGACGQATFIFGIGATSGKTVGTSQLVEENASGHAVEQRNQLWNAKDASHQLLILKFHKQ